MRALCLGILLARGEPSDCKCTINTDLSNLHAGNGLMEG